MGEMNTSAEEFLSEAQLMCSLRPHDNVIQILGVCSQPLAIVTKYYENGSLLNWIQVIGLISLLKFTPLERQGALFGYGRPSAQRYCCGHASSARGKCKSSHSRFTLPDNPQRFGFQKCIGTNSLCSSNHSSLIPIWRPWCLISDLLDGCNRRTYTKHPV